MVSPVKGSRTADTWRLRCADSMLSRPFQSARRYRLSTCMSLRDYSHVYVVGADCTPARQLQRAAREFGIAEDHIKGPFDWLVAPLASVIRACRHGFRNYFEPAGSRVVGTLGENWRVLSG